MRHDWLIVGSGISGLLCAAELKKAGRDVSVIDKGRGPGGRLASRSFDNGARMDFGAQFFTAYKEPFKRYVNEWLAQGLVKEWHYTIPSLNGGEPDDSKKYIATAGLRAIAHSVAKQLQALQETEIVALQPAAEGWQLQTKAGESIYCGGLVITAPLPQALKLLQSSRIVFPGHYNTRFKRTFYEPCLALMLQANIKAQSPVFTLQKHPVQIVVDNKEKGLREGQGAVTVHCSAEFSRMAWEWPEEKVIRYIIDALKPYARLDVEAGRLHRWRYSRVVNPQEEPFADMQQKAPLFLAGDAFGEPRVEGAAMSGLHLSKHILERY